MTSKRDEINEPNLLSTHNLALFLMLPYTDISSNVYVCVKGLEALYYALYYL
jgi:hypothetical protein